MTEVTKVSRSSSMTPVVGMTMAGGAVAVAVTATYLVKLNGSIKSIEDKINVSDANVDSCKSKVETNMANMEKLARMCSQHRDTISGQDRDLSNLRQLNGHLKGEVDKLTYLIKSIIRTLKDKSICDVDTTLPQWGADPRRWGGGDPRGGQQYGDPRQQQHGDPRGGQQYGDPRQQQYSSSYDNRSASQGYGSQRGPPRGSYGSQQYGGYDNQHTQHQQQPLRRAPEPNVAFTKPEQSGGDDGYKSVFDQL